MAWALALSVLAHLLALEWVKSPPRLGQAIVGDPPAERRSLTARLAPPAAPRPPAPPALKPPAKAPETPVPLALPEPAKPAPESEPPFSLPAPEKEPQAERAPLPPQGSAQRESAPEAPPEIEAPEPAAYADIEMEVGPDGRVIEAWVVDAKPPGAPFIQQALSAALKAQFEPYQAQPGELSRRRRLRAVFDQAGEEAQSEPAYKASVVDLPLGARQPSAAIEPVERK